MAMVECNCGEEFDKNAHGGFCPECGKKAASPSGGGGDTTVDDDPTTALPPSPNGKECPSCGEDQPEGAQFCGNCGEELDGTGGGDARESGPSKATIVIRGNPVEVADGDVIGKKIRNVLSDDGVPEDTHKKVSREHLKFKEKDDGFYVRDENSTNGTELNNKRIDVDKDKPGEYEKIADGDILKLANGTAEIEIKLD